MNNKPNVLIIADEKDAKILDVNRKSKYWNIFWEIIDYNKLKRVRKTHDLVVKHGIDFVLYSRNDQVANRISIGPITNRLRSGYSSFSGIDKQDRLKQMNECFEDFIECNKRLFTIYDSRQRTLRKDGDTRGTFSIIFDTEQLGGVKYGLPRILTLLNKYNVKATFFLTNLMKKIYSNVQDIIMGQGHELGLHGMWHEYLSDLNEQEQRKQIQLMMSDFDIKRCGANFIGRMNEDTLQALTENDVEYFVHPLINYYHFNRYPQLSANPNMFSIQNKKIWMLPISIETYGFPWFSIKNMIDSAILRNEKNRFKHLSILCHPFRDGNIANIATTEKLLYYLVKKGLTPITLKELTDKLSEDKESSQKLSPINLFIQGNANDPLSLPRTNQDFIGLILENILRMYKMAKRNQSVF